MIDNFLTAFLFTKSAFSISDSALSTAVYAAQLIITFILFVWQKILWYYL